MGLRDSTSLLKSYAKLGVYGHFSGEGICGFYQSLKMLHDPPKLKSSSVIELPFFTGEETKAKEGFTRCPRSYSNLMVDQNLD